VTKKNITVSGSVEFTKFYKSLGKTDPLKIQLDETMDLLKKDPTIGNRIKTNLWPKKYMRKFGINNLYRYRVGTNWRVIYTILGKSDGLVCVILDMLDHKNYDILFGYKTS
jgi:mRNA-degrading endonuclease RelE of RelBE toxin-antitoxin system